MAIPSPRNDALGSRRPAAPLDWWNEAEHRRKLAELLNITSGQLQDLVNFVRDHTQVAVYGGFRTTTTTGNYSLGGGYTQYTNFDVNTVTSKGTTFDTSTNSFSINANGVYSIFTQFVFDHNESNQGRSFNIRVFNTTDSTVALGPVKIGVGRNTPVTNYCVVSLLDVTEANEDDNLIVEIGGGSSINGTFERFEVGVCSVGEIQGTGGELIDPADDRYD